MQSGCNPPRTRFPLIPIRFASHPLLIWQGQSSIPFTNDPLKKFPPNTEKRSDICSLEQKVSSTTIFGLAMIVADENGKSTLPSIPLLEGFRQPDKDRK